MIERIGIGIITCNRPKLLKKLVDSIRDRNDCDLIIINDGDPFLMDGYNYYVENNETNLGVAKSKNKALKYLLDKKCDHIFLIEDDMYIKDPSVFEKYIETSKVTGIQHLMFAYHGPANKGGISKGEPIPRLIVNYTNDVAISLNIGCVGSFCYYTKSSLEDVGLIDEQFKNAFDHVSHSYSMALKGYTTPYWWWADVWNSTDYIEEQICSEEQSTIKTPERIIEWENNIKESLQLFYKKFGYYPAWNNNIVPDTSEQEVLQFLKNAKR